MRIIAGKYKNKKIVSNIKGASSTIKPTTSKIRESVFNIINNYFAQYDLITEESSFLDLCCGTGAIGIEAISRGFKQVYFLDNNYESLAITKHNLTSLKQDSINWRVIRSGITNLQITGELLFDVVYLDPPYNMRITNEKLDAISDFIHPNSLLIIETPREISSFTLINYEVISIKHYGNCVISVLKLKSNL